MQRQIIRLSDVQMLLRPTMGLIITSDKEMEDLERDPNMKVRAFDTRFEDSAAGLTPYDGAYANVAYDFFFGGDRRDYFPTSPQCIRTLKKLHDASRKHGIGFGASVLSPLDLGPGYYREKGRGGRTYQFQEGSIPPDGAIAVTVRIQLHWFHNKGPVPLHLRGAKAFAFSETKIGDSPYYAVDPQTIIDVSDRVVVTRHSGTETKTPAGYSYMEGVVHGNIDREIAETRNRVLAVLEYDIEEMDYFHPDALPFIKGMLDTHKAAGIIYDGFYSDEMHIQFDWDLGNHFGLTEIAARYITPGLIDEYSRLHGKQYQDFLKYLVYFAFAQHSSPPVPGRERAGNEPEMAQHVFGPTPADICATWKFRRDYFRLLQDRVVDLFIDGKRYGEKIFGRRRIWTRAHATWQESPTCDHFDAPWKPRDAPVSRYDYTPAYEWSATIRESISACADYFRWGDFLTGMGTDHPEGGYIDRNYHGAALAASFGAFNDVPYSYWACWGSPGPVVQRVSDVAAAYGLAGQMWNCGWVQNWQHRKTPVLALYPLDLNYVEERYGSWMVQYGYCDWITEEKLAELAEVLPNGRFRIKDREYSTLVALYEPMVCRKTMRLVRESAERGGSVLWCGPPPGIYVEDGGDALSEFKELFGLTSVQEPHAGISAEDAAISFAGALANVPAFRVPTHLLPDRVYPVGTRCGIRPATESGAACCAQPDSTEVVARITLGGEPQAVGTLRPMASGGRLIYFGTRPRDDQSGSTPDAPRTLFRLLRALGAYRSTGEGWAEAASNTGDLLVCEFPNGAVSITHHYYKVQENWAGGFFREKEEKFDESVLPPSRLTLDGARFGQYRVTYDGERVLTFHLQKGNLIAFSGVDTRSLTINGNEYPFADDYVDLTFAPVPENQLSEGIERAWLLLTSRSRGGSGDLIIRLPFAVPEGAKWAADPYGNGRGEPSRVALIVRDHTSELRIPPDKQGQVLYIFAERDRSSPSQQTQ